jgi:hypothetical protein
MVLLAVGFGVSGFDFLFLLGAAAKESVLHIPQGVGLLDNLGLLSTVIGNAFSLYIVRRYYDYVCAIRDSKALVSPKVIKPALSRLRAMIRMHKRAVFIIIILVAAGAYFWTSNLMSHYGDPQIRWGHKLFFDTRDHHLSFIASRVHNFVTWVIIGPFVLHVMIVTTFQLRRMLTAGCRRKALKYDLLNPDQRGGFGFAENAHIVFNVVVALIYVIVTMHIITFERMNPDHFALYLFLTLALVGTNWVFLGDIYEQIKILRSDSLNEFKDRFFANTLDFEVYKYCMKQKVSAFSFETIVIKTAGFIIPPLVQLLLGFIRA